ncbi:hypothetical protein Tco_0286962 [Tanacetum coccineum]
MDEKCLLEAKIGKKRNPQSKKLVHRRVVEDKRMKWDEEKERMMNIYYTEDVIDPKDKGEEKFKEEDESESESEWYFLELKEFKTLPARIEADRLLAEKLQEEEREQFTVEERAKFLHDIIAAQRKFLAQQRSEAIRNRPPTKNQLRNQMIDLLESFRMTSSISDLKSKKMNEKEIDSSKNESVKKEEKEEEEVPENVTFESCLRHEIMEKKSVFAEIEQWYHH